MKWKTEVWGWNNDRYVAASSALGLKYGDVPATVTIDDVVFVHEFTARHENILCRADYVAEDGTRAQIFYI